MSNDRGENMKIKFVAGWNTDYNIYCFINDIWNMDGKYNDILTHENDYTHLVIMNGVNNSRYRIEKQNTYGIIIEPYWSNSFDKNMLTYCKKIVTYQTDKYEAGRTIFSPLIGTHRLYNYGSDGEPIPVPNTTRNILTKKFEKNKTLSIIVANHGFDTRSYVNYNHRQNLVTQLMNSDLEFDMYGFGWHIHDKRFKGPLINKINGIANYKYTIALENSPVRGEITEKIIDAILCDTIPIYNGTKDIEEFYPNSCEYLEYDGNEINRIREIINSNKTVDDYSFEEARNRYFNVYNPIKIILDDIMNEYIN